MRHLLAACILTLLTGLGQAEPATATPWPTRQWTHATPASQGLDAAALARLVEYLATPRFATDSVVIVRHGRVVLETYAAPYRPELRHDLRSVTKAITSTLVGAALQQGQIASEDDKVLSFFPERKPTSPGQEALRVRHLLDMRAGIDWREWPYDAQSDAIKMFSTPDLTEFILARPVTAPGERFHYMGAAAHLLSAIITRSTGSNAAGYARRHLFQALGIESFEWPADARGDSVGDSRLRMRTLDLARIALLYLRNGRWEDRQLLPSGWAERLFVDPGQPHGIASPTLPPTYRSLWWTDGRVPYAAANGRHGQYIVLLPQHDLALVTTAKAADEVQGPNPRDLVHRYLLKAVKSDAALPPSPSAQALLERATARLARRAAPPSRQPAPAALAQARRTYVLEPNSGGYREFSLALDGPQPRYTVVQAVPPPGTGERLRGGALGLAGQYVESEQPGQPLQARRGRWLDQRTFRIESQQLEAAYVAEWTARFRPDGRLDLLYTEGEGETLKLRGRPR